MSTRGPDPVTNFESKSPKRKPTADLVASLRYLWPYRRIVWPDFWVPINRSDALDGLGEVLRRARAGQLVEVACRGGRGRTGTALAALAVLDGMPPGDAVDWVRRSYHPKAVETPWQERWVRRVNR